MSSVLGSSPRGSIPDQKDPQSPPHLPPHHSGQGLRPRSPLFHGLLHDRGQDVSLFYMSVFTHLEQGMKKRPAFWGCWRDLRTQHAPRPCHGAWRQRGAQPPPPLRLQPHHLGSPLFMLPIKPGHMCKNEHCSGIFNRKKGWGEKGRQTKKHPKHPLTQDKKWNTPHPYCRTSHGFYK